MALVAARLQPLPRVCYEAVPVFLKASQVGFQQPKYSLGFPCVHARRPQADYEALLPLQKAGFDATPWLECHFRLVFIRLQIEALATI